MSLLTGSEELEQRVTRILNTFARADSTLQGVDVRVNAVADSTVPAPAWSTDHDIFFNLFEMKLSDFRSAEGLVSMLGLNYHELAHLRYTPSSNSGFRNRVKRAGNLHQAWNALEDQRIERLLCGKYIAVAPYLTAVFMRFIIANAVHENTLFPLAVGRRHLPKRIRAYLRKEFGFQQHADAISEVVDAYLAVRHPRDDNKAFDLVVEFERLMSMCTPPPDFNGHMTRPGSESVPLADQDESDKDGAAADALESKDELTPEGDEDWHEDSNGIARSEGDDDEEDSDNSEPGDSAETLAKSTKDRIESDRKVVDDVESILGSLRGKETVFDSRLPYLPAARYVSATPEVRSAIDRFAEEMQAVYTDVAPGWETHLPSGRVNVQRAMGRENYDTMFDRWNPGNAEAFSIEAVLINDMSGSMSRDDLCGTSSVACWAVKRAFERLGGEAMTTVLGYDTKRQVTLHRRTDTTDSELIPVYEPANYTDPSECLSEARLILDTSIAEHKVVIIMTDGRWDAPQNGTPVAAHDSIQMMNDAGVITVLVNMYSKHVTPVYDVDGNCSYDTHDCQVHSTFFDWSDLVKVARGIVLNIVRSGKL